MNLQASTEAPKTKVTPAGLEARGAAGKKVEEMRTNWAS